MLALEHRITIVFAAALLLAACGGAPVHGDSGVIEDHALDANVGMEGNTVLGIHAGTPVLAEEVGAQFIRMMALDRLITCNVGPTPAAEELRALPAFAPIREIEESGLGLILLLRFPKSPCAAIDPEGPDRVPFGLEREHALALQEAVIRATAPSLVAYSVQNEVVNGPGRYEGEDILPVAAPDGPVPLGTIPAVEWLQTLAINARRVIDNLEREGAFPRGRPLLISHSFVFNKALAGRQPETCENLTTEDVARVFGAGRDLIDFHEGLVDVANRYTDAIDLHLHVDSVATADCTLRFMKSQVSVPVTVLEWSQAHANDEWRTNPVSAPVTTLFADTDCAEEATESNEALLTCLEAHPTDLARWGAFIATSPAAMEAEEFLNDTWDILRRNGARFVAYSGGRQYGSVVFDPTQLVANLTAAGRDQRNEPFYGVYRRIAEMAHP